MLRYCYVLSALAAQTVNEAAFGGSVIREILAYYVL
jgi:hypothetical protein